MDDSLEEGEIPEEEQGDEAQMEEDLEEGEIDAALKAAATQSEPKHQEPSKPATAPTSAASSSSSTIKLVPETTTNNSNSVLLTTQLPPSKETDLDKTWKLVSAGSADFATWTKLLSLADSEDSIEQIRKAYNAFLAEFPLCYVYWKKLADHELAKGHHHKVLAVYQQAVTEAFPHSVELWTHYCSYFAEKSDDLDEIRNLFERGIALVGTDFASHSLWDKYIDFENSQEEYKKMNQLYLRILSISLEQTTGYWERYKTFVAEHSVHDVVSNEEMESMLRQGIEGADKQKTYIMSIREKLYLKTMEATNARRVFEVEVLKVNYFHVRPLDEAQLNNWTQYLEFEERQGDHARIVKLYERCIVPCANYSKFWLKYIKYLERCGLEKARREGSADSYTAEEARAVFKRACYVFLKRRPNMQLEYAAFEEEYGNVEVARHVLENLTKTIAPGHAESILRYIALEKRHKNYFKCEELYTEAIRSCTEESSAVFFYVHFARMVGRVYESPRRAREIFSEGIEKYPHHRDLWTALIQFEKKIGGDDVEERVAVIYDSAIHQRQELSTVDKMALLADWIEYCNDEGRNIHRLRSLSLEYRESFLGHETANVISTTAITTSGVKRPLEDGNEQPAKVARTADYNYQSTATTTGTADGTQPDYSYYGSYYGYDYNSYGSYGNYSNTGTTYNTTGDNAYDPTESTY